MALDLPSTPASAPPNFYSAAGQMAAGQAAPAAKKSGGKAADKDDKQQFMEMITKLLSVFAKMEKMKPNGKDISKFTKAMAKTASDCLAMVSSDTGDGSDATTASGTTADATGDATGAAAAAPTADTGASSAGGAS